MNLPKKDLEKIRSWLIEEKLDENSLDWLKRRRVGLFEGGKVPENVKEARKMLLNPCDYKLSLVDSTKENISFTIQDILNALTKNDKFGYTTHGNLSKESLIELANIANVEDSGRKKKLVLLNEILERIPKNC